MVRRGEPRSVAPAATLLAYLSWRGGNGLHAGIALDRALESDPAYPAAGLMSQIIGRGLAPDDLPPLRNRRRKVRRPRRRVS
jgi:hypothetical protein